MKLVKSVRLMAVLVLVSFFGSTARADYQARQVDSVTKRVYYEVFARNADGNLGTMMTVLKKSDGTYAFPKCITISTTSCTWVIRKGGATATPLGDGGGGKARIADLPIGALIGRWVIKEQTTVKPVIEDERKQWFLVGAGGSCDTFTLPDVKKKIVIHEDGSTTLPDGRGMASLCIQYMCNDIDASDNSGSVWVREVASKP